MTNLMMAMTGQVLNQLNNPLPLTRPRSKNSSPKPNSWLNLMRKMVMGLEISEIFAMLKKLRIRQQQMMMRKMMMGAGLLLAVGRPQMRNLQKMTLGIKKVMRTTGVHLMMLAVKKMDNNPQRLLKDHRLRKRRMQLSQTTTGAPLGMESKLLARRRMMGWRLQMRMGTQRMMIGVPLEETRAIRNKRGKKTQTQMATINRMMIGVLSTMVTLPTSPLLNLKSKVRNHYNSKAVVTSCTPRPCLHKTWRHLQLKRIRQQLL